MLLIGDFNAHTGSTPEYQSPVNRRTDNRGNDLLQLYTNRNMRILNGSIRRAPALDMLPLPIKLCIVIATFIQNLLERVRERYMGRLPLREITANEQDVDMEDF